ncbi:FkbM family methyltransferase [Acidimangrovimonas sediminis]|uniref:FkbM family methyltransferase n=1 Tax=Acidimangrovimonas sediminis TaxID=2056283 RepID=UPI000C805C90|nr:FkbM family methyltransferase [Acidimangrovimonas sediminis]
MKLGIVTPIGPGHGALFTESCLPSVQRAAAHDLGPFDEVVLFPMDDTEGRHGRSNRRNAAVRDARAQGIDWIFFLDADDVLPPTAFAAFGRVLAGNPALDAVFGLICTLGPEGEPELREDQPATIDSYDEFLSVDPFLAVVMGHFVRCEVAAAIPFDETMDTGEDYFYYTRLWRDFSCVKRPEILYLVRRGAHSTGPRSATGKDWTKAVGRLWAEAVVAHPLWARISDDGVTAEMRVTNPQDLIQRRHLAGQFFEAVSLRRLKGLIRPGGVLVDVGANIGNHVVWYAQHLAPRAVLPVEPNPAAIDLLEANIARNGIAHVIDRRGIGLGAGRAEGRFRAVTDDRDNLGATRLVPDARGDLHVATLDTLLGGLRVDFLKIDAEGMELEVLEGAAGLIARDRPVIWVEVQRANILAFAQGWCRANGYRLADSMPYVHTMDYFAVPEDFEGPRPPHTLRAEEPA